MKAFVIPKAYPSPQSSPPKREESTFDLIIISPSPLKRGLGSCGCAWINCTVIKGSWPNIAKVIFKIYTSVMEIDRISIVDNRIRQAGELLPNHRLNLHISAEYGPLFGPMALLLIRRESDRGTFVDTANGDNAEALRRIWEIRMEDVRGRSFSAWEDGRKLLERFPDVLRRTDNPGY